MIKRIPRRGPYPEIIRGTVVETIRGNNLVEENIIFKQKEHRKLDHIEILREIKTLGEQSEYGKKQYLNVLECLMTIEEESGFDIYRNLTDPQEIIEMIIKIHYKPKPINKTE